jgi:thymidylate synthase
MWSVHTLWEMMAGWLGVELGSYTHFGDSLHVYVGGGRAHRADGQKLEPNTDQWMLSYRDDDNLG